MEKGFLQMLRNNQLPGNPYEMDLLFGTLGSTSNIITRYAGYNLFTTFPLFWPQIHHFPIEEDDIIIATFPKSGTTWLQQITYLIVTGDFEKGSTIPIDFRIPFLEYPIPPQNKTYDDLAARPKPRMLKTHLPACYLPKDMHKGKVIFAYRNAKDAAVSYYHHYRSMVRGTARYEESFETYAREFMQGEVAFGPYEKSVLSYHELQQKGTPWLLMLRYEDIKADTRKVIRQIAEFLGKTLSEEMVEKIYEATTAEAMRKNDATNYSWLERLGVWKGDAFIRKGIVGDWKNYFTDAALLKEFDDFYKERLPKELIIETP